jgi:flagellar biosynthetic protein FliQ
MPVGQILDLGRDALWQALLMSLPLLVVAMVVGLLVSVIQAVTSIQEQTLAFVPKLLAVGAAFLFLLSWMLQSMVAYTMDLFRSLPNLVG